MPRTELGDMACTEYLIRPCETGGWMSRLETREAGPYATRDFALRVAVADALRVRAAGREVRIAVQDAGGAVCAERCLCERFRQGQE